MVNRNLTAIPTPCRHGRVACHYRVTAVRRLADGYSPFRLCRVQASRPARLTSRPSKRRQSKPAPADVEQRRKTPPTARARADGALKRRAWRRDDAPVKDNRSVRVASSPGAQDACAQSRAALLHRREQRRFPRQRLRWRPIMGRRSCTTRRLQSERSATAPSARFRRLRGRAALCRCPIPFPFQSTPIRQAAHRAVHCRNRRALGRTCAGTP
jgi:hypothetical protein